MPLASVDSGHLLAFRLTQVIGEYGASAGSAGRGTASGGSSGGDGSVLDNLAAQWYAVVPVSPLWVVGGGLAAWIVLRGARTSGAVRSGGLATPVVLLLGLGILYALARWQGVL